MTDTSKTAKIIHKSHIRVIFTSLSMCCQRWQKLFQSVGSQRPNNHGAEEWVREGMTPFLLKKGMEREHRENLKFFDLELAYFCGFCGAKCTTKTVKKKSHIKCMENESGCDKEKQTSLVIVLTSPMNTDQSSPVCRHWRRHLDTAGAAIVAWTIV